MLLTLRVIFTILSAVCLAALIPIGSFLGLEWAVITLAGAALFFALMTVCKTQQEKREKAQQASQNPTPDFLHPRNDENNA